MNTRPETAPMQFGNDWCGIFIRGDNAYAYANSLRNILDNLSDEQKQDVFGTIGPIEGLVELLKSCDQYIRMEDGVRQYLKEFEDCVK